MKTYRQFSEEAQQLDEIGPGALLAPIVKGGLWAAGGEAIKGLLKLTGKGLKGAGKFAAKQLKGKEGSEPTGESTPSTEPGLPRAS